MGRRAGRQLGAFTYRVDLVEPNDRLEEAEVGPREPVPQQVTLSAQHGLGVVCWRWLIDD